jgi:RNA polymerase-binding transcription factor DksA
MLYQEIYQLMKYKRDELTARLTSIKQDFTSLTEQAIDGDSSSDNDDVLFSIAHQTKVELANVKNIMSNIEQGNFGLCQKCGETIEIESLNNNPFEKTCNHCKNLNL